MQEQSVITRTIRAGPGVLAPGHLGELTQTIDFGLVDAVLEETGTKSVLEAEIPAVPEGALPASGKQQRVEMDFQFLIL